MVDIAEVTAVAISEDDVADHDLTGFVLLGMRPDQDTVADPYASNPVAGAPLVAGGAVASLLRPPRRRECDDRAGSALGGRSPTLRPAWIMDRCENRSGGGLAGLPLTRELSSLTSCLKLDTLTDAKANPDAAEAVARGPSLCCALPVGLSRFC